MCTADTSVVLHGNGASQSHAVCDALQGHLPHQDAYKGSNIVILWKITFSGKLEAAISLSVSICPKCVG